MIRDDISSKIKHICYAFFIFILLRYEFLQNICLIQQNQGLDIYDNIRTAYVTGLLEQLSLKK